MTEGTMTFDSNGYFEATMFMLSMVTVVVMAQTSPVVCGIGITVADVNVLAKGWLIKKCILD